MTPQVQPGWAIPSELRTWLRENLAPGAHILELGSGDGTKWLLEHWRVTSVEHDPAWLGRCATNYIEAPIQDGWYAAEILRAQCPHDYDLLLVDGPPACIGRGGMLQHLDIFDLSRPIVVDDAHRPTERTLVEKLAAVTGREAILLGRTTHLFAVIPGASAVGQLKKLRASTPPGAPPPSQRPNHGPSAGPLPKRGSAR